MSAFIDIAERLRDEIRARDFRAHELVVLDVLLRYSYGEGEVLARIEDTKLISGVTGIRRDHIESALARLVENRVVVVANAAERTYLVRDPSFWAVARRVPLVQVQEADQVLRLHQNQGRTGLFPAEPCLDEALARTHVEEPRRMPDHPQERRMPSRVLNLDAARAAIDNPELANAVDEVTSPRSSAALPVSGNFPDSGRNPPFSGSLRPENGGTVRACASERLNVKNVPERKRLTCTADEEVSQNPEGSAAWVRDQVREFVGVRDWQNYDKRWLKAIHENADLVAEALGEVKHKLRMGIPPRKTRGAWLWWEFRRMEKLGMPVMKG